MKRKREDKNSGGTFMVCCGTPDWQLPWICQGMSRWQQGLEGYSTEQLQVDRTSIYNQSRHRAACKQVDGKFLKYGSREWHKLGVVRQHIQKQSCKIRPVKNQYAAARGCARQVCKACLWHLKGWIVTKDPSSSPSLHHLNLKNIILMMGIPNWSSIFQLGRTMALNALSLSWGFLAFKFLWRNPKDLFAVFDILVTWDFHERSLDMSTPWYLAHDTTSSVWPWRV